MRIIKLSRCNLQPLERELDRIAEKHGFEPRLRMMPSPDVFNSDIILDDEDDLEEDD